MIANFSSDESDSTLRIGFPSTNPIEKYEPTNIHFAHEYLLLENIHSTLVELDPRTGAIQPGIADSYAWNGDALEFHIRTDMKTKSGQAITAEDVVYSFKRLLVLSGNTHGNFKDLVCPDSDLKSIEEPCPGIYSQDGKVVLTAGKRKSFLLPMLTTIDFAVFPKSSINPKTLGIENSSETSGVYWVSSSDDKGNIQLEANKHHYHYSNSIPQKVVLVPSDIAVRDSTLKLFREGKVDHLMTYSGTRPDEIIKAADQMPDASLHLTMKIQTLTLVFTERGSKELSPEYRRFIGGQIREAFSELYSSTKGYQITSEFFPAFGDGGLSEARQKTVAESFAHQKKNEETPFRIGFLKGGDLNPWLDPISKRLPQANAYLEKVIPGMHAYAPPELEPHAVIMSTDSGFKEDISLISYSLNAGYFGLSKQERAKWLAEYMSQNDSQTRLESLRKLHFDALSSPVLVPLVVFPYAAMVRKPWKMELSEIYANNQLWLIKRQ